MGIFKYIGSQFAKPKGFGGKLSTLFMNMLNKQQYASVVKCFNSLKSKNVLDIGFGNGYLLSRLSKTAMQTFTALKFLKICWYRQLRKTKRLLTAEK